MNLAALRLWMMVAELGSFSRAAEALFISQPAVSKRVQELEQMLGIALLDRSGRTVRLTEAGQIVYRYGQQIFANAPLSWHQANCAICSTVIYRLGRAIR